MKDIWMTNETLPKQEHMHESPTANFLSWCLRCSMKGAEKFKNVDA